MRLDKGKVILERAAIALAELWQYEYALRNHRTIIKERYMFMYMLLNCRWSDGGTEATKRGNFEFGWKKLEIELFMDRTSILTTFGKLEKINLINVVSKPLGHYVSICNYDTYVNYTEQTNKLLTSNKQASTQSTNMQKTPLSKDKEEKEEKEEKENKESSVLVEDSKVLDKRVSKTSIVLAQHEEFKLKEASDKLRLLAIDITTPELLIEFWYEIMDTFGLEIPRINDDNARKAEWAFANSIIQNKLTDNEGLKLAIYNHAKKRFLNFNSKYSYDVKKVISPLLIQMSSVYRHMVGQKFVKETEYVKKEGGYSAKRVSVYDTINKYNQQNNTKTGDSNESV